MGSHFLSLVAYGYEVLGGILIFYSSAVTESSMPEDRKKVTHWIMFGVLAAVYIAFGVGLRYVEIQQSSTISQHADEDRRELRENRERMSTRMDNLLSSFQAVYFQMASLSSDLGSMRNSLLTAMHKNDPARIADLEHQAQAAQQQADNLSRELLAVTMAPQIAQQLRDWTQQWRYADRNLSNEEWEEKAQIIENPNRKITRENWPERRKEMEQEFRDKLKGIVATADFVRKEMLQRIPPQSQFPEDKNQEKQFSQAKQDPDSLNRDEAARYLESLARRVPPPQ
jgi:hypothetical protein